MEYITAYWDDKQLLLLTKGQVPTFIPYSITYRPIRISNGFNAQRPPPQT